MTHHHAGSCPGHAPISRRAALLGLGAAAILGNCSMALASSLVPSRAKLVVLNVIGGLDGLSAVAPYGDANLAALRSSIMTPAVGKAGGLLDLGGFFGLHPALPHLHAMFVAGEALAIHAVGNTGAGRSHFQGQDYLQSGATELLSSGWLDRAAAFLPQTTTSGLSPALILSPVTPLSLSGPVRPSGWSPNPFAPASQAFSATVQQMTASDPLIGPAIAAALSNKTWINATIAAGYKAPANSQPLATLAAAAGSMLAAPGGPSVAVLSTGSFDTHADQVAHLNASLPALDQALLTLRLSLGEAWASTIVLTMTEFGRTAYCNNESGGGTDHGTGFAVFVAGGGVAGGKVLGSWPGLSPTQLLDGRDLAATTDFRAIAATILGQHMGLSASQLALVFPGAPALSPVSGIFR